MQRRNGLGLLTAACFALLPACTSSEPEEPRPDSREWLNALVVSDGISEAEANRLADIYFCDVLGIGCGVVYPVTDEGGAWVARTAIGPGGLPGSPIVIDKRTGRLTCGDAPPIEDAQAMQAEIERSDLVYGRPNSPE